MKNVEMAVVDNILTIKVDLTREFGPSSSGKTIIIATTEGNVTIPDHEDKKVGLMYPQKIVSPSEQVLRKTAGCFPSMMNKELLLSQLTELPDKLGYQCVRKFQPRGSNRRRRALPGSRKIHSAFELQGGSARKKSGCRQGARKFDLSNIYLKPFIRELLEGHGGIMFPRS